MISEVPWFSQNLSFFLLYADFFCLFVCFSLVLRQSFTVRSLILLDCSFLFFSLPLLPRVLVYTYNPSTLKTEAEGGEIKAPGKVSLKKIKYKGWRESTAV